jgi:hypothetical protein
MGCYVVAVGTRCISDFSEIERDQRETDNWFDVVGVFFYFRMKGHAMKRMFALTFLLYIAVVGLAQAQGVGSLYMFINGELWVWDQGIAQPQPVDFCTISEREPIQPGIVLSPDGNRIAFRTQPEIVTEAVERMGGVGGGELPSNIWVCNLETRELTPVAVQPSDASFFAESGEPDKAMVYGVPTWSLDGTMLAWTQFEFPEFNLQLASYDMATGETSLIVPELPPQYGVPVTSDVKWGDGGIALVSYEASETPNPLLSIIVYDPQTGNVVGELEFPEGYGLGTGEGVWDVFWVDDGGEEALGIVFLDDHFEVYYPEIGTSEQVKGLELYSLPASEDAVSLLYAPVLGEGNDWAIREGDTFTALPTSPELYELSKLAISPDGDAAAYVDDQVYVWRDGAALPVPMTELANLFDPVSLVWAPLGWRAFRDDVPILGASGEPITCPGFMVSRLIVGERGSVSDDLPNNVRQEPNSASPRIGEIPSGGEFAILAGPICAENLAWWQVDYNGLIGWTAEGQREEYWLQPLS